MKFESPLQLKNKVLKLTDNQIFGFAHSDGLSERSLIMEMVVDKDYDYELFIRSSEKLTDSHVYYDNRFFEFILKGHLPVIIENLLEELVLTKRLGKQLVSPPTSEIEDIAEQQYLFKNGDVQVVINMPSDTDAEFFESPTEKAFYAMHNHLNEWIEKTYSFMASNS